MLDRKSYAIRKRDMVSGSKCGTASYDDERMDMQNLDLMAGDKLEVTLLPGLHSSVLISVLWISCVIFVTVLFTYTYTAIQEMWWY